ncbi:hypothetical protein B0H17DRAFT_1088003, partial [Mycena rosella]
MLLARKFSRPHLDTNNARDLYRLPCLSASGILAFAFTSARSRFLQFEILKYSTHPRPSFISHSFSSSTVIDGLERPSSITSAVSNPSCTLALFPIPGLLAVSYLFGGALILNLNFSFPFKPTR